MSRSVSPAAGRGGTLGLGSVATMRSRGTGVSPDGLFSDQLVEVGLNVWRP